MEGGIQPLSFPSSIVRQKSTNNVNMASSSQPAAEVGPSVLQVAYDGLRIANKQLQDAELELGRLLYVKAHYFPKPCASSCRHQANDGCKYSIRGNEDLTGRIFEHPDAWDRMGRLGLLDSADNLDQELEKLRNTKTRCVGVQQALRCCINQLSRPFLKNLNILDLPDEILLSIFEYVEDWDIDTEVSVSAYPNAQRKEDISNTRLVCRRFCHVSSQLLVRIVRVNFTKTSLERLDQISRHPTIAKGVHLVRISLHLYNYTLTDFASLLNCQAYWVQEQADMYERCKMWEFDKISEHASLERIAQIKTLADTLRRIARAVPRSRDGVELVEPEEDSVPDLEEDEKGHRARLLPIHREYLTLFNEQRSLIDTGSFSRTVGSALARMPCARKLAFGDADLQLLKKTKVMDPRNDVWSALRSLMLQPLTSYDAEKARLPVPSYEPIISSIEAIGNAGAWLKSIDMSLSSMGDSEGLLMSPDRRRDFSSGIRQLTDFSFRLEGAAQEDQEDAVGELLSACLDTASLKKLRLDMRGSEDGALVDVGHVLGSRARPKLTHIFLAEVGIQLASLRKFLKALPETISYIGIYNVHLTNGTWEEALDVLRQKSPRTCGLTEPAGAECDDMAPEDYKAIFDSGDVASTNQAESYIMKWSFLPQNPLRALRDKEQNPDELDVDLQGLVMSEQEDPIVG